MVRAAKPLGRGRASPCAKQDEPSSTRRGPTIATRLTDKLPSQALSQIVTL